MLNSNKPYYMSDKLSRIIKFAQSTGDKLIVTDSEGNDPVVIMPFEMYEHLILMDSDDSVVVGAKEEGFPSVASRDVVLDDLALEASDQDTDVEAHRAPEHKTVEKSPIPMAEPPTLAEKQSEEDFPEEEQFYLEPVQ